MSASPEPPVNAAEADPTVPTGENPHANGTGEAVPRPERDTPPGPDEDDDEVQVGLGPTA